MYLYSYGYMYYFNVNNTINVINYNMYHEKYLFILTSILYYIYLTYILNYEI